MHEIPDALATEMQARTETDLTRYWERAYAVQERDGQVSVAACISAEDIETLKDAMILVTFARTLGTAIGMTAHDAAQLDALIGGMGGMVASVDDATVNWKDEV